MSDDREERSMQMVSACLNGATGLFEANGMKVSAAMVVVVSGPGCYGVLGYDAERYATDAEFLDQIETWIAERRVHLARAADVQRNLN